MRVFTGLALAAAIGLSGCSGPNKQTTMPAVKAHSTEYDAALANELGADPYGMRSYIFATLLTGPNDASITDEVKRAELFKGHFSNMAKLAEAGQLVLAGPFVEAGNKRGLFILNVATVEEAEALVETDPAVAAGIFTVTFDKYYGSAALQKVGEIHKSIQEKEI